MAGRNPTSQQVGANVMSNRVNESALREAALERANGRCEFPDCTLPRPKLEMAHLHGKQMGGSRFRNVLDNVAMLCKHHHDWLDGVLLKGRRFENEMVLRAALSREWKERR